MDLMYLENQLFQKKNELCLLHNRISQYRREEEKLTDIFQRTDRMLKRFTDEQSRKQQKLSKLLNIKGSERLAQQIFEDLYRSNCGNSFSSAERGIYETKSKLLSLLRQTDDLIEETKARISRLEGEIQELRYQLNTMEASGEGEGK